MNRIRNTFNKKPPAANGVPPVNDENRRPTTLGQSSPRSSYAGSRASSSVSIPKEEPPEYKLSVVDGNVYLPPSPPEKKSFWPRTPRTNSHRSLLNENEPFTISRESFESYRRSFDISARSPVCPQDPPTPRLSIDSRYAKSAGSHISSPRFERPDPTEEEVFEDVGLDGDAKPIAPASDPKQQNAKKRGIFSRFGEQNTEPQAPADAPRPNSSHRGFHLSGRKRGQSGQGAELGNIDRWEGKESGDGNVG